MPPMFWSDSFEEDFDPGVTNAQGNYYDVVNLLHSTKSAPQRCLLTARMSLTRMLISLQVSLAPSVCSKWWPVQTIPQIVVTINEAVNI